VTSLEAGSPVAGPTVVLDFLREKGKAPVNVSLRTPTPNWLRGFLFAALFAVAACTPNPTPSSAPSATATATATASPANFPLTVTDDEGTSVTLPAKPARIISLAPSFTEIVFALGEGSHLVGITDSDDFPPDALSLPHVASYTGVVFEKVVDLKPDLVLAAGNGLNSKADIDRLRGLGYPVLVAYPPTVSAVLTDIKLIGHALGDDAAAQTLTASIQQKIDSVTAAVAGLDRPRTFYEIGYEPDIYGPTANSFIEDEVNLAGGTSITTGDPAVSSIPLEKLVTADPQVIVLGDAAYGTCPDSVYARPGWADISAIKDKALRPVNDIVVTRPGPRIADGLALLALAIHPDASIQAPAGEPALCAAPGSSPSTSP
jgi:iron complex transport system substrate-binding protein